MNIEFTNLGNPKWREQKDAALKEMQFMIDGSRANVKIRIEGRRQTGSLNGDGVGMICAAAHLIRKMSEEMEVPVSEVGKIIQEFIKATDATQVKS